MQACEAWREGLGSPSSITLWRGSIGDHSADANRYNPAAINIIGQASVCPVAPATTASPAIQSQSAPWYGLAGEHAIESIRVGVEDYEHSSHGRLLASVRSIHAGILLLYKEALRRVGSDEVLLKARIIPRRNAAGTIQFFGEGKKTVDIQQIRDRFGTLGIVRTGNDLTKLPKQGTRLSTTTRRPIKRLSKA